MGIQAMPDESISGKSVSDKFMPGTSRSRGFRQYFSRHAAAAALGAVFMTHASAQAALPPDAAAPPALPEAAGEARILIASLGRGLSWRTAVEIRHYSALIEMPDHRLVVCSGVRMGADSYARPEAAPQDVRDMDEAGLYVTSPQIAEMLRPAPKAGAPALIAANDAAEKPGAKNEAPAEDALAHAAGREEGIRPRSFGSCMPYRVHLSQPILDALRRHDPQPLAHYMGSAGDAAALTLIHGRSGVLMQENGMFLYDPSKRPPGMELPQAAPHMRFDDPAIQAHYERTLTGWPHYRLDTLPSCPDTGFSEDIAAAIAGGANLPAGKVRLRGCAPL
jgi:hypothetical protein